MCGITGYIDYKNCTSPSALDAMVATLNHRGPDDRGTAIYREDQAMVGLGQTRLSIIDLSPAGHQPMEFEHLSIVFNGEVYNYREIKEELHELGHRFNSTSDTEMILHAFEEWGTDCVERFIGMFAFVIYDKKRHKVFAFRDRAGVKPFYYYHKGGLFLFGSELKALMKHPAFEKQIDPRAVRSFFNFGYIPTPYSIFENANKLEPGSYLEYDLDQNSIRHEYFWDATEYYRKPKLDVGYEEAKEELHSLMKSAFKYRMVADVPVGVFLSSGYDSTSVAAILQNETSSQLKTFTIGFEQGNNEAPYAKDTAEYLGTNHHEYYCTTSEAQEIIPSIPYYYDEPFSDDSAIPTMLVSRFARKHVTVALSADAGDELFAGYNSYPGLLNKLRLMNQIPDFLKYPSSYVFSGLSSIIPISKPALKHKLDGISRALNRDTYQQAADLFKIAHSLPRAYMNRIFTQNGVDFETKFDINTANFHNEAEVAMAVDYQSYLQNEILTKVDRATMSVSLEGRDPLVDHRLLEFAARLPFEYKYDGNSTKRILKDIVHEYVPREMMNRPKSGFTPPINKWLRNDLSYLVDEHLNDKELAASGMFNVRFLSRQVEKFRKDKLHYSPLIWKLLMFQMWHKKWM